MKKRTSSALCAMVNTHGILKLHAENTLAACSTVDFREVTTVHVAGTRPRTFSFCCFCNNLRFQKFFEVQMATSSSRVFKTKRECLDQNSLELSSSANSSASMLAQVKNSSA